MSEQQNEQRIRVLRIGVIRGGKLAEEHKIRPGKGVTVGDGPKSTIAIEGVPKRFTLFQPKDDGYQLAFTGSMSGKLALEGGIKSLKELAEADGGGGDVHYVQLNHPNRGKVVIGDVTVLFQFVPAPVESVRKVTRQDFRPRLLDEDDPVFLGSLSLFSAVGAVMLVYAANTEPVETISIEELPDRFVNIVIPEKAEEPPPEIEAPDGPEVPTEAEPKKEEAKEEKKDEPPAAKNEEEARQNKALDQERKKADLQKKSAVLAMLGTRGANNNGSVIADVLGDGDAALKDLDAALQGVSTAEAATGSPNGLQEGTGGSGREDASVDVGSGGGGGKATKVKEVKTAAPKGRTSVGKVEAYDGEGADAVRAALRKYQSQLKACYESRLKQNPNLSGRVLLEIDVLGGKVSTSSIVENSTGDGELGTCISRRARGWKLPSDTEGTFAMPLTFEGA